MFESILAKEMSSFLELRKSTVNINTYKADVSVLADVDKCLVENHYCCKILSEDILNIWINSLVGQSKTIYNKVGAVRNFTKYLNDIGNKSFVPYSPNVKSDYIPYIYSDAEITEILHYADNLPIKYPNRCNPYITAIIPMVLRILYGCGTRLGETIALQRMDIDFKRETIFLRKTKFSKERLIPVHKSLMDIIEKYCLRLGIMHSPNAFLFPGAKQDQHFSTRQILSWFDRILQIANIAQNEHGHKQRGACLHSMRHLFVLKSMQQLEKAGYSVDLNDLILPTYLGHKCLLDTDKYMRFSGAQIPEALEAFEAFTVNMIPEVEVPQYED